MDSQPSQAPTETARETINPPMEGRSPGSSPLPNAASPHAMVSAPRFGGNRGGRKRADGLVPGSREAVEADRKKDAERKKRARAASRAAVQPEPLPPGEVGPVSGKGAPSAMDDPLGSVSFSESGKADFIAWQSAKIKPLSDKLIDVLELADVRDFTNKATEANLPAAVVKEIKSGAHWEKVSKTTLQESTPELAAELLNETGISAKHQNKVFFGLAALSIIGARVALMSKLDSLCAEHKKQKEQPQEAQ